METDTKNESSAGTVRQTSAGWMLKRLCAYLDADMNDELRHVDLNLNQFAVLMTLLEVEGLTQAEIGRRIAMPGYSTTRSMDSLEEKRLVDRRPDERSRRSHRIYLTEQSRALAPELFAIVMRVNQRLLAPLDKGDRERLVIILEQVLAPKLG